jgi:hypothetical protein
MSTEYWSRRAKGELLGYKTNRRTDAQYASALEAPGTLGHVSLYDLILPVGCANVPRT